MTELFPTLLFIAAALALVIATYRGIRRGGARFYTLEREAILRRAILTLGLAVLFFMVAIVYLLYERQQSQVALAIQAGETVEGVPTMTPTLSNLPPTATITPTIDPDLPSPTPTSRICRAVVRGTAGSGLNLREEPGGQEVETLQEESILTLMEEAPVSLNDFTWIRVRTVTLNEGWVALDFLFISDEDCLSRVQQPSCASASTPAGQLPGSEPGPRPMPTI